MVPDTKEGLVIILLKFSDILLSEYKEPGRSSVYPVHMP